MQDVAEAAQVSQTTVSFVLSGRPDTSIAEPTRQRVLEAAQALGYRPNAMARALRQGTSTLVGLISDEVATTPFAGLIVRGAQDAAWQHRRILALVSTSHRDDLEQEAIDSLLQHQVDTFLIATMFHRRITIPPALRGQAVVLVNCVSDDALVRSVVPDEQAGGRLATTHLLEHGHTRIGIVDTLHPGPAATLRLQGHLEAMADAGLAQAPDRIVHRPGDQEAGEQAARQLLDRPDRPTALFCLNDRAAMGAQAAARSLGLRMPEDLSLIGYDNQEVIAAHLHPALTTMQLPHHELGYQGASALLGATTLPPGCTRLACPLVRRASVSPPARTP